MTASRQVELELGSHLVDAGDRSREIYFPSSGVISLMAAFSDGNTIEMATIGNEGCTGIIPILGGSEELSGYLVQVAGHAHVLEIDAFQHFQKNMPSFRAAVTAYAQAFLFQVLVSGACNGIHDVEQRLSRWLLMMHDRSEGDQLRLTHSFLAGMLGVHRPSVTNAARALQKAGAIENRRGLIVIRDRAALASKSCECIDLTSSAYDNLFSKL